MPETPRRYCEKRQSRAIGGRSLWGARRGGQPQQNSVQESGGGFDDLGRLKIQSEKKSAVQWRCDPRSSIGRKGNRGVS